MIFYGRPEPNGLRVPPTYVQNPPIGMEPPDWQDSAGTTVPTAFVNRMLSGARARLPAAELAALIRNAGIAPDLLRLRATRVTRGQFARLYAAIAIHTGDEMLGLWSRPIRAGALKYLGMSLLDAPSVLVALYRFTRFWNLLLDDYRLELERTNGRAVIRLVARSPDVRPNVFGHELMVKLIHGIASWLVRSLLPIEEVGFAFRKPDAFSGYSQLFPADVRFDRPHTAIGFPEAALLARYQRTKDDLIRFVRRAPDDWLFHTLDSTSLSARVRAQVLATLAARSTIASAARALRTSGRSLARHLAAEGTSYRGIRDSVRRDIAIDRLVRTTQPIARIAADIGFVDVPAFHRAFRQWTGSTPTAYRRQRAAVPRTTTRRRTPC